MDDLEINNSVFESIKHIDKYGNEYWSARELGKVLEYSEYRKFLSAIKKAIISCKASSENIENHFAQSGGMVDIGSKTRRKVIAKNGGTMPEKLPTPDKSLKDLEKEKSRLLT